MLSMIGIINCKVEDGECLGWLTESIILLQTGGRKIANSNGYSNILFNISLTEVSVLSSGVGTRLQYREEIFGLEKGNRNE